MLFAPLNVLQAGDTASAVLGTAGDLAFETGAFMRDTAHAGHKSPPADWQSQSGPPRMNARWEAERSLRLFIEDQQRGGDYVAAGRGEAGVLCGEKQLIENSAAFIRNGIAFQRPDGLNPEEGGADHHYQALGLLYACRYYRIVADDALRAEMRPMLNKAFAWLLARVRADGSVDVTGNARTGFGQEMAHERKPKGMEYRLTTLSLAHWAQLTQNAALEATARRVFEADRTMRARGQEMTWDGS